MTPEAIDRERTKSDYIGGKSADAEILFEPTSPAPPERTAAQSSSPGKPVQDIY